jgi:hypothetical protein
MPKNVEKSAEESCRQQEKGHVGCNWQGAWGQDYPSILELTSHHYLLHLFNMELHDLMFILMNFGLTLVLSCLSVLLFLQF